MLSVWKCTKIKLLLPILDSKTLANSFADYVSYAASLLCGVLSDLSRSLFICKNLFLLLSKNNLLDLPFEVLAIISFPKKLILRSGNRATSTTKFNRARNVSCMTRKSLESIRSDKAILIIMLSRETQ